MARILIADDSAVVRMTVRRRLRAEASSGRSPPELVECASFAETTRVDAASIDCALLDYDLGDGRGIDLAPRFAGVPVAFFTSEDDPALVTVLRAVGPVFGKPDDLGSAVAWALQACARL
jgi:DNA-binding NarL/FixJ family response regulator